MTLRFAVAVALTASLALAAATGVARADATLVTGSLPITAVSNSFRCTAVNIGTRTISMNVAIANAITSPPSTTTAACPSVAPGGTCTSGAADDAAGNIYCKITAPASPKTLRGTLMIVNPDGSIGASSDAR